MSHDGQILEKLLSDLGIKKGALAQRMHKNPNTITRWLTREHIPSEDLIEIGTVLRYDLTSYFPRLKKIPETSKLHYFNSDPDQLLNRVEEVEAVYTRNEKQKADLEQTVKFNEEQINNLKEIIEAKNEIIRMQKVKIEELLLLLKNSSE